MPQTAVDHYTISYPHKRQEYIKLQNAKVLRDQLEETLYVIEYNQHTDTATIAAMGQIMLPIIRRELADINHKIDKIRNYIMHISIDYRSIGDEDWNSNFEPDSVFYVPDITHTIDV